jgi:hypothetical protein
LAAIPPANLHPNCETSTGRTVFGAAAEDPSLVTVQVAT